MADRTFRLPDPGEGLAEAEITAWLVREGDDVELNQPIAEVETEKAAVELPSPYAGRVVRLHAPVGELVAVGQPLITIDVPGAAEEPQPEGVTVREYATRPPSSAPNPDPGVRSTPAVRALARRLGVDLATVEATGPEGRLSAEDVRRAAGVRAATVSEDLRTAREASSATRRTIAENLTRQAAIPQVTTFRTVDASALEAARSELGVSPLPVVIVALGHVIADHPRLNADWAQEAGVVEVHGKINVGLAVDTDRGLLVPVVRDAGRRGIREVAEETRRLAQAAREGRLAIADLANPTITVSNTGSYGSEAGTPILSPGTAVTLAIGVIEPRALVVGGAVEARPACTLSLTFDHRVLDGAEVGRALSDLVELLQDAGRLGNLRR